jgi:hypothetical protein
MVIESIEQCRSLTTFVASHIPPARDTESTDREITPSSAEEEERPRGQSNTVIDCRCAWGRTNLLSIGTRTTT